MPDLNNFNKENLRFDAVNDSVIALPDAVAVLGADELSYPGREGIGG